MSLLLKVTERPSTSPVASDEEHGIYGDITSCHFSRDFTATLSEPQTSTWTGIAKIAVREPVKTADAAGFHEIEKTVVFSGVAYLMNENGRTISSFTAKPSKG